MWEWRPAAVRCGRCGEVARCDDVPDVCASCGYEIERRAVVFSVGLQIGACVVSVHPALRLAFVGEWTSDERARERRAALAMVE